MTAVVLTGAEMTWRARFYLTVAAFRHGATALVAWVQRDDLARIDLGMDVVWWAVVFALGAAHLAYAAMNASENHARVALAISAVMTSVWAAAFVGWWANGGSPLLAIVFIALTLKDLTIVRDPMRSPFEPILREYADDDGK